MTLNVDQYEGTDRIEPEPKSVPPSLSNLLTYESAQIRGIQTQDEVDIHFATGRDDKTFYRATDGLGGLAIAFGGEDGYRLLRGPDSESVAYHDIKQEHVSRMFAEIIYHKLGEKLSPELAGNLNQHLCDAILALLGNYRGLTTESPLPDESLEEN